MKISAYIALAAATVVLGAGSASASVFDVAFSGTVASGADPTNYFGLGANESLAGQDYSEIFAINTANIVSEFLGQYEGPYLVAGEITINKTSYEFANGVYTNFTEDGGSVNTYITNTFGYEIASVGGINGPQVIGAPFTIVVDNYNFFPGNNIVETSNFDLNLMPVLVTSAGISSAPEPSTWALMMAGVAGIGLMFRRFKNRLVVQTA